MKRKISSLRPLIPVATFGLLTVSAQPFTPTKVMLLPSESPNRLRGSFRMAFNVKTSFENVGAFTSSPPQTTPNGDAFNYDDGYVLTDSSGNMMGYTRYWGYTSGSQLPGNGTILMNRYSSGGSTVGGHNDEMLPGFELTYRRELGQGEKLRWGLEASGNYMHVSVSDSRTVSAGATRFTDTYALPALEGGGFVSPPPPPYYQGPDLPPGGSIVIGATPVSSSMNTMSSSVSGSRHFESEVIGFRLGPYVEMPLGRNGKLSLSGGLSLAQVLSDFDFNESIALPGAPSNAGGGDYNDLLVGGFISGEASYKLGAAWEVYAGVQFQHVGKYSHHESGRTAVLDLGKTVFVSVGFNYSF
jgi:hypothetical protein